MNCTYHPDLPAAAYCQFCGKPLCKDCIRNVGGSIFCESCLAERLRATGPAPATGDAPQIFTGTPHPMLAALLGFIPGVGAMYNGQYAKAIAHVLIFAVLASLSDHSGIFGLLVAAWVFYQVFDAYQTAVARRDGLPLPNPFGLNDIAQRLGIQPQQPGFRPGPPPAGQPGYAPPPAAGAGWEPVAGTAAGQAPPTSYAGFAPQAGPAEYPPYPPPPPYPPMPEAGRPPVPGYPPYGPPVPVLPRRDVPVGAIILIGLGLLFLFSSLGILQGDWIGRGWPLLIIGLGLWVLYKRTRGVVPPPPMVEPMHAPGQTAGYRTDFSATGSDADAPGRNAGGDAGGAR